MLNRRQFIITAGSAAIGYGCDTLGGLADSPNLRFGVISDIHLTIFPSSAMLEKTLRYFSDSGVDAVMIVGDLSDYGTRSGWRLLKDTWDGVFANTSVIPLFCTGNHDVEGWRYGDMAADMFANGETGEDRIRPETVGDVWTEVFEEAWEPVRLRTVRGYSFVSIEYGHEKELAKWLESKKVGQRKDKPFFFFQHMPMRGTTADSGGWSDGGAVKPVLDHYPNCVAFTGHTHRPFYDERSIWQGSYTAIAVPSLSYSSIPYDHENGNDCRDGGSIKTMPVIPTRRDHRGGLGYIVDVWSDRIVVERHDFLVGEQTASKWIVPQPFSMERLYAYERRAKISKSPEFPPGASIEVRTSNTENRQGKWVIVVECRFPSAMIVDGTRVYDYELRVVSSNGSVKFSKLYFSPAFAEPRVNEPKAQRFWFGADELPRDIDCRVEAVARNSFGKCSAAIYSRWLHAREPSALE